MGTIQIMRKLLLHYLSSCYDCMFSQPSMLHIGNICSILLQIYVPRTLKITNIFILWIRFFIQLTEDHCGFLPHVHCMLLLQGTVGYHSTDQNSNNEENNTGERDYNGCNGSVSYSLDTCSAVV